MSAKVAVFTAIYGGYDRLKPFARQRAAADFFCFTDAEPGDHQGWTVRRVPPAPQARNPRLASKWSKMHPHLAFWPGRARALPPRYDRTIWIDASMEITSPDFVADLAPLAGGTERIAMFGHPERDCAYDELGPSMAMRKYDGEPIAAQLACYRRLGFPAHAGLMATGVIVRDARDAGLAALGEAWWRECVAWSYQDQVSLPFLLWRAGRGFRRIPGHVYRAPWFRYEEHLRDD